MSNLILPDIHGRSFWRKPVEEAIGKEHIIFLGDYVDPYSYEGIAPWEAYARFGEIVELKKAHPDDITLLLGNHDLHYMSMLISSGRYDVARSGKIRQLILDNSCLFQITHIAETDGKNFLFSHAGIRLQWLEQYKDFLDAEDVRATATALNKMWEEPQCRQRLYTILSDAPYCRMGNKPVGSPVWNDVDDMAGGPDEFPGWYQVFGHTQQELDPVIGKHFACLDCRMPFRLTDEGIINFYPFSKT
jgi:hypothetical protein